MRNSRTICVASQQMVLEVHVKLNARLSRHTLHSTSIFFTSKLDLNWRKKLVKCYIWSTTLYGAETWTLRYVDEECLVSFQMWCWRRMEKISWTDRVRHDVLQWVNEEMNILQTMWRRNANWIVHTFRTNCILKRVIEEKTEGRIQVTGRRGRRRKQQTMALRKTRPTRKLKEEATDRTLWRTHFGRGYGPIVRQNMEWNEP